MFDNNENSQRTYYIMCSQPEVTNDLLLNMSFKKWPYDCTSKCFLNL